MTAQVLSSFADDDLAFWRATDAVESPDFDDALGAVLDEVARLPLRDHAAFLAEQSDEIRAAALACIAVRGGDCVDAAEGMRDEFAALRRATRCDWRDPRVA